ncbi:MAG: NAD-dependent epimerase/dehydratase family protein [Betaproteobacteria bacterium]|nr:NAD-dependent epimerase/dehydratase family protein [Betaproteobacteria bacterium]
MEKNAPLANPFRNRTALVTGGTGSFGHAVIAPLLSRGVREIRIFSRDELKQELMRIEYAEPRLKFFIGDVRSRESVDQAMTGVDFVFHAAALKQVPSCDFFPMQAVLTNVIGSNNVIESAIAQGVGRVICLSTDKAVYPINAMGMTKGLMEKLAQAGARSHARSTIVPCVRYGNVMHSRGSVIALFLEQIRNRQPITVTEPSMTRFLLALPEAIELVIHAFEHADQGDIFIQKAPACTIADLVTALKRLFGSRAAVSVIGMRHGEKIYKTLATREEMRNAEDRGDYLRLRIDARDLNYAKYFTEGDRQEVAQDDYTSHNTRRLDAREVEKLLRSLPEIRAQLPGAAGAG